MDFDSLIQKLSTAGIESPRLEARLLKENASDEKKLEQMLQARLKHQPLDKILGRKEFYKYTFKVNADVLSPRPDTETLVEAAAKLIEQNKIKNILELGVGSGCILLSLLADFPNLKGKGIDRSASALKIAAENAKCLGVESRCSLQEADWFDEAFINQIGGGFEMVVSNPPYIPHHEIETLETEVKKYDPWLALDGGLDGLESYRRIADLAPKLVKDGGFLLLEAGVHQAADIIKIICSKGLQHFKTEKDLSGIERCIIFQKRGCNL